MEPVVSVLLTHHLDVNRPYLNWAMEAVLRSKGVPLELIVLADSETKPDVPEEARLVWDSALNSGTKKINHGVELMNSPNLLIHSDDVVLSESALFYLVHMGGNQPIIQGVLSNSDLTSRYLTALELKREKESLVLLPDMDMKDLESWKKELFAYNSPFVRDPILIRQETVCYYCTYMPKDVFTRIGPLDEELESRYCDFDHCMRAAHIGVSSWINLSAFAFHFGSKTLNITAPPEVREEASRKFAEKVSKNTDVYAKRL